MRTDRETDVTVGVLGMEEPRIKHCQLLHNDTVCLLDTPCEPPVADESGAPVAVPGGVVSPSGAVGVV